MVLKRTIDIVLGSLLATIALPVIFACAIGCTLSLHTWPFFVQRRVGKDGRVFPLPKLRTLPRSTPRTADKYQLDLTRIPWFCRMLRGLHIDELPQLFVVPLGFMSLVGPRPEMPALLERYPTDFAAARHRVRPGCTGLWQVSVASQQLIFESPEYDLAYVDGRTLRLDAWVMYRTIRMWATGRGAVELADVPRWAWEPVPTIAPGVAELPPLDLRDTVGLRPRTPPAITITFHNLEEVLGTAPPAEVAPEPVD